MADTYEISKRLWGGKMEKSEGATKGRGDERDKAGDIKEEGEKRATPLESSSVPGENKKNIDPVEGKIEGITQEKGKNPPGETIGATKGQGDERDKAGDVKENGEKRALPINKSEEPEDVEKCNLAARAAVLGEKKKKIGDMVKSWEDGGREGDFILYLAKSDKDFLKEMSTNPELWDHYCVNFMKSVHKDDPQWNDIIVKSIKRK